MKNFKPMLAGKVKDVNTLNYPILGSVKLDGIRCVLLNGKALSRNLKPIRNNYVRNMLESTGLNNLDGELIIDGKRFNDISSGIMSESGEPKFSYYVFDYIDATLPFNTRQSLLNGLGLKKFPFIKIVPQTMVHNVEELLALEVEALAKGYEGVMTRDPLGPYKYGRSGDKEGYLLKLKRFKDSECIIIDAIEQMHNTNEATKDNLGHTERSTKKEGMVGAGMLGSLVVQDIKTGVQFEIGTGFNRDQRIEIWNNFESFRKNIIKYKYQELSADSVPRFPVYLGIRAKEDM